MYGLYHCVYTGIIFQILFVAGAFHIFDTFRDPLVLLERTILVLLYRSRHSPLYVGITRHVPGKQHRPQMGYKTIQQVCILNRI